MFDVAKSCHLSKNTLLYTQQKENANKTQIRTNVNTNVPNKY